MRSRDVMLSVLLAVVAGCSLAWLAYLAAGTTTPLLTQEKFEQINLGMTPDEVVAIIGTPPGDYRVNGPESKSNRWVHGQARGVDPGEELTSCQWQSDDGFIRVDFDQ